MGVEFMPDDEAGTDVHASVREALKQLDAQVFGGITCNTFKTTQKDTTMVAFQDTTILGEGKIHLLNGTVKIDGRVLGQIAPKMIVKGLARCISKMHNSIQFGCTHISDDTGAETVILDDNAPSLKVA